MSPRRREADASSVETLHSTSWHSFGWLLTYRARATLQAVLHCFSKAFEIESRPFGNPYRVSHAAYMRRVAIVTAISTAVQAGMTQLQSSWIGACTHASDWMANAVTDAYVEIMARR
jgi:hypothetical protein